MAQIIRDGEVCAVVLPSGSVVGGWRDLYYAEGYCSAMGVAYRVEA